MFGMHFLFHLENLVAVLIHSFKCMTQDSACSQRKYFIFTIVLSLSLNTHTHPSCKATNQVFVSDFFDSLIYWETAGRGRRKEKEEKKKDYFYGTEWYFYSVSF